ncbi:fungal fruit body lectin-domain-containing protein [Lactarius pseudohatsudake]|nr:fungal fruit body lectin-domain-containing protein [Lactarius pseudohatsudake]
MRANHGDAAFRGDREGECRLLHEHTAPPFVASLFLGLVCNTLVCPKKRYKIPFVAVLSSRLLTPKSYIQRNESRSRLFDQGGHLPDQSPPERVLPCRREDGVELRQCGTSGALRLLSNKGEGCIITLGVHNYKRWGDIITNLKNDQTACVINPQYYSKDFPDREKQRERQLTTYAVDDLQGRKFSFEYVVADWQRAHSAEIDWLLCSRYT